MAGMDEQKTCKTSPAIERALAGLHSPESKTLRRNTTRPRERSDYSPEEERQQSICTDANPPCNPFPGDAYHAIVGVFRYVQAFQPENSITANQGIKPLT